MVCVLPTNRFWSSGNWITSTEDQRKNSSWWNKIFRKKKSEKFFPFCASRYFLLFIYFVIFWLIPSTIIKTGRSTYLMVWPPTVWLSWLSTGLLRGRSRVQTPIGPTFRVFKELRRRSCLCNDTCWLDSRPVSQPFNVYNSVGRRKTHTLFAKQ